MQASLLRAYYAHPQTALPRSVADPMKLKDNSKDLKRKKSTRTNPTTTHVGINKTVKQTLFKWSKRAFTRFTTHVCVVLDLRRVIAQNPIALCPFRSKFGRR